jgi:hypothetical protein
MADGQPTPIIGFLNSGSSAQFADFVAAFQKGLREAATTKEATLPSNTGGRTGIAIGWLGLRMSSSVGPSM